MSEKLIFKDYVRRCHAVVACDTHFYRQFEALCSDIFLWRQQRWTGKHNTAKILINQTSAPYRETKILWL